jgi:hypothetical protein
MKLEVLPVYKSHTVDVFIFAFFNDETLVVARSRSILA